MKNWKTIIVVFWIATLLVQVFATVTTIVRFRANQQYYARVLCINKNRPELACNGKCVLMQALQAEFDNEQQNTQQSLQQLLERDLVWFCLDWQPFSTFRFVAEMFVKKHKLLYLNTLYNQNFFNAIFHPPALLA